MRRHVRITVSRFPGEHPTYGASCVTCGLWLGNGPTKRRAKRLARSHERGHA